MQFGTIRAFQELTTMGYPDAPEEHRLDAYWLVLFQSACLLLLTALCASCVAVLSIDAPALKGCLSFWWPYLW